MDEQTDVSALISEGERDRVASWVEEAVAEGATVAHGGEVDDNGVLLPTVLTGATPDDEGVLAGGVRAGRCSRNVRRSRRRTALANDTRYGLQAAIFTNHVGDAMRAFQALDFGGVLVNEVPTWRADQQPYGGVRDSGNTREGPAYSVREMTELRMIILSP